MSGVEIDRIHVRLAERPRPADLVVRRQRIDILCADYALPPDVTVEAVVGTGGAGRMDANGRVLRRAELPIPSQPAAETS